MLWTEQYVPKCASDFLIHKDIVERFQRLAQGGDLPHLIFNGQPGCGKSVLVRQLLRELFGAEADSVTMTCAPTNLQVTASRTAQVDIRAFWSPYHVELTPSDYGRNDVHVVQHEMKQIADRHLQHAFSVMVLNSVEQMSKASQHALRRTMEKASKHCRLIMCCSNLSQVIDPIKSRCTIVRVPYPSVAELHELFESIADEQGFPIEKNLTDDIIKKAGRNIRRCVLSLQATYTKGFFAGQLNSEADLPEWQSKIKETADSLIKNQTAKAVFETRKKLYELLAGCIPPTTILATLFDELLPKLRVEEQHQLIQFAAHYDHEIRFGGKAIYHLEAFVVEFLSIFTGTLLLIVMDARSKEIASLESDAVGDETLSTLSTWLDRGMEALGDPGVSAQEKLTEAVAFVEQCRQGDLSDIAACAATIRIFEAVVARESLFDANLECLLSLVSQIGNAFERCVQRGDAATASQEVMTDLCASILDFSHRLILLTAIEEATGKEEEATQALQTLGQQMCRLHVHTSGYLVASMQNAMIDLLVVPLKGVTSANLKAHSLNCLLMLWMCRTETVHTKGKRTRNASSVFAELCISVATRLWEESEESLFEFYALLSTALDPEMKWNEPMQMLECLSHLQTGHQRSGLLSFLLLPNLLPALIDERPSVRKIFFSVLIAALQHLLSQGTALEDRIGAAEMLIDFVQRGLCDKNANVRLKIVSDLQLLVTDISLRPVAGSSAVSCFSILWTALLAKLLDASKSVRTRSLQCLKKTLAAFNALPQQQATFLGCLLERDASFSKELVYNLVATVTARPDSPLFQEGSVQMATEILHTIATISSCQSALLTVAIDSSSSHSHALFASLLASIHGECLLGDVSRSLQFGSLMEYKKQVKRLVELLPAVHLRWPDKENQDSMKTLCWSCLLHLFQLVERGETTQSPFSCRTALSLKVICASLKKEFPKQDITAILSLLYTLLTLFIGNQDFKEDDMGVLVICWAIQAIKRILEQLQTDQSPSDLAVESKEELLCVYSTLLFETLKRCWALDTPLAVQDALINAISICQETKEALISSLKLQSLPPEHMIISFLSILIQECKSMKKTAHQMKQRILQMKTENPEQVELDLNQMSKEEQDEVLQSVIDALVTDLVSKNNMESKFNWLLKEAAFSKNNPFLQAQCFSALWQISSLSQSFMERFVVFNKECLAQDTSGSASTAELTLSCCAELIRSATSTSAVERRPLVEALTNFLNRLLDCGPGLCPALDKRLLKKGFYVLGLALYSDPSLRKGTAHSTVLTVLSLGLMSDIDQVEDMAMRVVKDQIALAWKGLSTFLTGMLCSVPVSSAVAVSRQLVRAREGMLQSTKTANESALLRDLIQFYTEAKSNEIQSAVVELLVPLKPTRQSLTTLLEYYQAFPQALPPSNSSHGRNLKLFIENYTAPPISATQKQAKGKEDRNAVQVLQNRLLSVLGSTNIPTAGPSKPRVKRGKRIESEMRDGEANDIAELLLALSTN